MSSLKKIRLWKSSVKGFLSDLRFLTYGLSAIGGLSMFGGFVLGNIMYRQNVPDRFLGAVMAISLPWVMASCLFIIRRQEIPRFSLPSIRGRPAIFQGVFCLTILVISEVCIICLMLIG